MKLNTFTLGGLALLIAGLSAQSAAWNPASEQTSAMASPNPKLRALPRGTAVDLGLLNLETPDGEPAHLTKRVTDYSGMVYDPHHHRILMFGGGHSTTFTDAIYAFSFDTLKWKALYKPTPQRFYKAENMDKGFWKTGGEGPYPRPAARHTYDLLIVPDNRKELLLLRNGDGPSGVAPGIGYFVGAGGAFDFETSQWEAFPVPFGGWGAVAEFDPVSKNVLAVVGQDIWLFDPKTRQSEIILGNIADKSKVTGYSGTLVYYPPNQRMYALPSTMAVWALELVRANFRLSKIVRIDAKGVAPPNSECAFAYDSAEKTLGGCVKDNTFFVFDPRTNAWSSEEIKGAQPGSMTFHCLVYDPVDGVYIFIAGGHTFAYRAASRG